MADIPNESLSSEFNTRRFVQTLEAMISHQERLLLLLQREKHIIIEGSLNDLIEVVGEKEGILRDLERLERLRLQEVGLLETARGKPTGSLTLTKLAEMVAEPDRARLISSRDRLEALSGSLTELNQINGLLIDRVLRQVGDLMTFLRHLTAPPSTYEASGAARATAWSGRTLARG